MKVLQGAKLAGGNPSRGRANDDFYATHPDSTKALLNVEKIIYPFLEPACGEGHISKLIENDNEFNLSCDLVARGYGLPHIDFLIHPFEKYRYKTIITNPPFSLFQQFVEKALRYEGVKKVIMFGKLQALEGQKRATFLQNTPLRTVYVFKKRQQLLPGGKDFKDITGRKSANTMAFAWYVWEHGYKGKPTISWI